MNIREIKRPITAAMLNESLAQKYGTKINIGAFTLEQLEDARNKLRTQLRDIETNESFNAVQSESYQKSKLFLDVLNTAISEAEKPDFLDLDKDGDKKEPMKKAAKDAGEGKGSKPKKGKVPPQFQKKNESVIREGEEDKAELVMAAKDMVDRVTGWMEDTAEMQTESMLELADAIRDEMGSEISEQFTASIKPALEAMYTAMESTRISLTGGVGMLTGEGEAPAEMGAEDDVEMEPTVDGEVDVDAEAEAPADDDFAADAAAAGGEEAAGRETRESIERSRKLGTILSKKK